MALTEDRSIALSSIILALFTECFLEEKWLLHINACRAQRSPECKIPVELNQEESHHESGQKKNAEIVWDSLFGQLKDSLFGRLKDSLLGGLKRNLFGQLKDGTVYLES